MKTHTFSVVVGTDACNAACPFCVAKITASEVPKVKDFDQGRFNTACRIVEMASDGLITVLLTGKGEPMLYPKQITDYIDQINFRFPLIELQTNGTLIKDNLELLRRWRDYGLTLVCISMTHVDHIQNNSLMGIPNSGGVGQYRLWETVELLQETGLNVRLNCTMLKSGIHKPVDVERVITKCAMAGVDQLTFREVEMPDRIVNATVADWIKKEKPMGAINRLRHYLEMKEATKLLELPHGAIVYDVNGQNVCLSNCLTGTTDPNDIRQIIFFPDGRIAYDWRYPGARIL
jgi:molybdenum cofactor biosynthesis enzyme MoaA